MSNMVVLGRFASLLVAAILVSAACGNGGDNSAPEESVPSSAGTALNASGQDSDVAETEVVETDDENAPVDRGDEDEEETAQERDSPSRLVPVGDSATGVGARVPATWVETRSVSNDLGGFLFEVTENQARFGRGEGSGLQVFVGIPPFEPTVESVVSGVRFGSPISRCEPGGPGEQDITLSSGQPALWLDCEEPQRSSILIVGEDPTQPDATVVVVTEPGDPAHDQVIESVTLGDPSDDGAGGELTRVTDDSSRLSVVIPPGWDWDGAPSSTGQPMVGATLGAPGDALDVPTIQFFTVPLANDPGDALDQLLDAFGFETACDVLLLEPDTVGGIRGERADGLLCGPNLLVVVAFVGPIGDGSGEAIVFLMSAEHQSEPTPGAVLATIEIN